MSIAAQVTSTAPAWIAAAAAVIAALFAALATVGHESYANYLSRRGIAKILDEDLHRWEGQVVEAFYNMEWWREGELLDRQIGTEELKQAATALDTHEWWTLSSARRWVEYLEARRKRRTTMEVGNDPQRRATCVIKLDATERRWLAETFYRLEAARWGLLGQGLPWRKRRDKAEHWRPYNQDNLRKRYAPGLPDRCALTTLDREAHADLDGLLHGVSEYLFSTGEPLVPDDPPANEADESGRAPASPS